MADTIAAIATGGGVSAIGIIRLSGENCIETVEKVFTPMKGEAMSRRGNRTLVYGTLRDVDGDIIDLCLCTVSRGPNSYTGEDTAELQCHGSPTVLRRGLEALFAAGARQARAGEFTRRAFLNGRMDLSQAEAVIDLIHAETAEAAKNAAGQLGGAIMRKIGRIYASLGDISAHYHAVIDYPDEDIDEFTLENYSGVMEEAKNELKRLMDSFRHGSIMQSGVPTVIIGRPNAGKSSLLNALLGYDRAIVTDVPGTTRDTITERVRLGNTVLRLTDTAGLRETGDAVERMGVERSRKAMEEAELILLLADSSVPFTAEDAKLLKTAMEKAPTVLVHTKTDLPGAPFPCLNAEKMPPVVEVSSVTGQGLEELEKIVGDMFPPYSAPAGEILTNSRQYDAVKRALGSIEAAEEAMGLGCTPDIVLTETENAMAALGELTGRTVREDITSRIFERFCVGK